MSTNFYCIICENFDARLRYFHVPNDCYRRQRWSSALNDLELKSNSKICEKHFLKEHITKSIKFNCFKLTKDAVPKWDLHTDEDDHFTSSQNDEEPLIKKKSFFRTVGIQTEIKDAGICAFVTVAENYMLYNVNCFHCDAAFSIRNWDLFIYHIRKFHRQKDVAFYDCGGPVVEEKIQSNMTGEETDTDHLNVELMDIEAEDSVENSQLDAEFLDNQTEELQEEPWPEDTTQSDETSDNDWEKESTTVSHSKESKNKDFKELIVVQSRKLNKKQPGPKDEKNSKIDVETSDPIIMNRLLDLFESYPDLWFISEHKSSEHAIINLTKKFIEHFKVDISYGDICDSLRDISHWYRKMVCEKQNEDNLTYPKSEYFRKCCKFLPDKPNGISCIHCKLLMPDHLQLCAHIKREHFDDMSANEDSDKTDLKFQGIPRTEVNNYLEVRYPQARKGVLYECKVCSRILRTKCDFFGHIKTHLNIRDYVCDICGTTFIRKQGLEKHKRRHFGLLKRVCKICNKVCNDDQLLSMHRQAYHRPIEGTIEEIEANLKARKAAFGRKKNGQTKYKTRIDPKTNENRIVCNFCDKDYKYYHGLHKHLITCHKDQYRSQVRVQNKLKRIRKKRAFVEKMEQKK